MSSHLPSRSEALAVRLHPPPRRAARAYTVIEVMVALTLLAIGASGVIAMQKYTSIANRNAKNLALANQLARTWVERLRTDALQWNHPSPVDPSGNDLATDTRWLRQAAGAGTGLTAWLRPADDASFGSPAFDALGTDVRDADAGAAVFCTNVRFAWLWGPPPGVNPPYLLRAEVRVFWLREGGGGLMGTQRSICDGDFTGWDDLGSQVERFHFVYVTSAIGQNTAH